MDISLSLINSKIVVVEYSSSYPRTNDCVKAIITQENCTSFEAAYFPRTTLTLVRSIQIIQNKLSDDELSDLILGINKHVEYAIDVANDENAMNDAGESI